MELNELRSLPGNSFDEKRAKTNIPEKKPVQKVISGTAKVKKDSFCKKVAGAFLPEDVSDLGTYILEDLVVPALRDGMHDVMSSIIDLWFGGRSSNNNRNIRRNNIPYVSYSNNRNNFPKDSSRSIPQRYNYDSIILNTRSEAEDVLLALQDMIDTYSMASVADLYDLVGVTGAYTDNKYGWTDITGSRPNHTRDGWALDLPRAVPLN